MRPGECASGNRRQGSTFGDEDSGFGGNTRWALQDRDGLLIWQRFYGSAGRAVGDAELRGSERESGLLEVSGDKRSADGMEGGEAEDEDGRSMETG